MFVEKRYYMIYEPRRGDMFIPRIVNKIPSYISSSQEYTNTGPSRNIITLRVHKVPGVLRVFKVSGKG